MHKKSWKEKLESPPPGLPKVVIVGKECEKRWGGRKLLIATPLLVDGLIRKVPKGKLATINQIRANLAKRFKSSATCPLTTGIFVRISAEAAEEYRKSGKTQITPWWRVVKDKGILNPKLPGGGKLQAKKLKEEGHKIESSGKNLRVRDFEKSLAKL